MNHSPATLQPLSLGLMRLIGWVSVALVAAAAMVLAALAMIDNADGWRGFMPATLVGVIAALASATPVWIGARYGVMGAVGGYFTASFVRALLALGGALLVVWIWSFPPAPTLLIMGVYYLAALAAESALIAKVLWNQPIPRSPEEMSDPSE